MTSTINKKNRIPMFDIFNKNKPVGSLVNNQYLKKIGLDKKNGFKITPRIEKIIEDDVTQWFNDNYKNLKPTLDYLKDK